MPPQRKNKRKVPTVKRYHGWQVLLFILGTLFPPLAVAARFGIGKDFFINLLLTICGYIPGHAHNFYIQNIRNNSTHSRTPKWAQRYGLVDTRKLERRDARTKQWASRYDERLPRSTLEGQRLEEGQEGGSSSSVDVSAERRTRTAHDDLWNEDEVSFYGPENGNGNTPRSTSGGRWHYPANFDDADPGSPVEPKPKSKGGKKDRWARTEDAYSLSEERSSKKKAKRKKSQASIGRVESNTSYEAPEDPVAGAYGAASGHRGQAEPETSSDPFSHEF